jgi:hypothetical protein
MSLIKSYGTKKDKQIYGNYQVLSPDNILMFRCDEKKARWYLSRNLAISIDQTTIRLLFKPQGLGNHDKQFGLTEMKNHCVCCGIKEFLTRHHVVPHEYRRYFPLEIKSHNFHDVLSVCVTCHSNYERKADELKKKISHQYRSPIGGIISERKRILKFSKLASTLLSKDLGIPESRKVQIKKQLKKAFYLKKLTKEKLIQISGLKSTLLKKTHGEIVISKCKSLQEFVEMWRRHFVETNNPKYLPEDWSVKTKLNLNKSN